MGWSKVRTMPRNLKATIVFAVASFATSGINYITTPVFTRLLSTHEYGTVQVYTSWLSIVQVFASMTLIYPGILNVGLYEHRENRWKYLSSMLGITSVTTGVLGLLYLAFRSQLNDLLDLPSVMVILMLLTCFFRPATIFWTNKQRYEFNYRSTFIVSVGSAVLAQLAAVVAVVFASKNGMTQLASVRLWSAESINLAVAAILFFRIVTKGKNFVSPTLWKTTVLVAIPLIPHYLSSVVLSSIDKIMISQIVGTEKTGIYSLAAIISAIGVLIWRALSVTFTPFINSKLGERDFEAIRKAVKPLLLTVGAFCVITSLAAPEIISILATKDYIEGVYVVPAVAASIFIHALYDNFTAISFFHKKSVRIMLATLTAALFNVAMNYLFIPRFGFIAAGYTTLASNLVLTGMHYINARQIEKEKVFDSKFSAVATLVVSAICLFCVFLYSFFWIRMFLILALLVYLFVKRRILIQAIVSMK